jgi:hypothetical protein
MGAKGSCNLYLVFVDMIRLLGYVRWIIFLRIYNDPNNYGHSSLF